MQFLMENINQMIGGYLWPLFRISSMLMVMAIFGATSTPMRIRLLLAVAITFAIAPILTLNLNIDVFSFESFWIILQQILIGIAMGFVSLLLLQIFVLTGQIIGMQTSLGFAAMVDPASGQQTPVIGHFFLLLTTMIFLAVDGHLFFIRMVIISFETIPISSNGLAIESYLKLAHWGTYMFASALSMSLAAVIALLLINLSFGVMTRAAPQLNIFSIGFPVTMISGLLILWLTLSVIMSHFDHVWLAAQSLLCSLIGLHCGVSF